MTANELVAKVKKIVNMYGNDSKIEGVYFNPMFASDLYSRIPELKKLGFKIYENSVESAEGTVISGTIKSPFGATLSLGTVILDGIDVSVQKSLVSVDKVYAFIRDAAIEKIRDDVVEPEEEFDDENLDNIS